MFFSIGRSCLLEAKLGEYVVYIIDNPPKKKKKNFKERESANSFAEKRKSNCA